MVRYILNNIEIYMLQYFEGCYETVADYLEDFAMVENDKVLKQRYQLAAKSGRSGLTI